MKSDEIRQFRRRITAAFIVALALFWAALGYQMNSERDDTLNVAEQHGDNITGLVAENFSSFANTIDLWAHHFRGHWIADPAQFPQLVEREKGLLKTASILQVSVVNKQGWVVYSNLLGNAQRGFVGDREHVKVHLAGGPDRTYISDPVTGRVSGAVTIQFTRPIYDASGRFDGVLVLSVPTQTLIRVFRDVDLGKDGVLAIRRLGGTVLVRSVDNEQAVQQPIKGGHDFRTDARQYGSFVNRSPIDGIERLFSFRRLDPQDLIVVAGRTLDSTFARYYLQRQKYLVGGAFVSVLLLALLLLTSDGLKREEQTQRELRASEARFRSLTELTSDRYWEQDEQFRFTVLGGTGTAWLNRDQYLIGKKRWEVEDFNMTPVDWAAHIAMLEARKPFRDLELCRVDADGKKVWISASGEPFYDESGAFKGYRGTTKNITERRTQEENLRRFRIAMDASADMVLLVDPAGINYVDANDAACRALGYSREELISMGPCDFSSETREQLSKTYDSLVKGDLGEAVVEGWYRRKDGSRFQVESSRRAVSFGTRHVIVAVARDITERKRAELRMLRLNRMYAMLSQTNQAVIRITNAEELFLEICRVAVEHGGMLIGYVGVIDPGRTQLRVVAHAGPAEEFLHRIHLSPSPETPEGGGPTATAIREERPSVCNDILADSATIPWRDSAARIGSRATAAFPFRQEGRIAGVLSLHAGETGYFDEQIVELLKEMAADISFALEHIEQSRARARAEASLLLRNRALAASVNAVMIVKATKPLALIEYVNPAFERITGYSAAEVIGRNPNFLVGNDLSQPAIEDIRAALREQRECHALVRFYSKDGRMFWNDIHTAPVQDETRTVTHFVEVFNDVTQLKIYQEQLEHQANFDALTGLANRNLLQDRLAHALAAARRQEQSVTVAWIDLDNFKLINDSLGHGPGDEVLKIVGERLKSCTRESDTLARLGGDEFVLVLPKQTGREGENRPASSDSSIIDILQRILSAVAEPIRIEERELHITCSIGVSLYPEDGRDVEVLLKNADAAMYRAKNLGRNSYNFYTAEINEQITERLNLRAKLKYALKSEEFVLHYQPKLELATGRMSGFEALLRWNNPELGSVPPVTFIPVLEESGMIIEVGRWVIQRAMLEHAHALKQIPEFPRVAVNVSAIQLARKEFVATVEEVIREVGVDPIALDMELTESLVMTDVEENIAKLKALRQLGIKISIDDFGTGYSSLAYLARLPIDSVKVDRSFIMDIETNPDHLSVVSTIISLAHSLELRVVAEGVETAGQKKILGLLRCDEIQGYFLSKPLPLHEALGWATRLQSEIPRTSG